MTFTVSPSTIITIAVLTVGLIRGEHPTSALLNLLQALTLPKQWLLCFPTSVAITLWLRRLIQMEDKSECSVDEDRARAAHPDPEDYLDDDLESDSDSVFDSPHTQSADHQLFPPSRNRINLPSTPTHGLPHENVASQLTQTHRLLSFASIPAHPDLHSQYFAHHSPTRLPYAPMFPQVYHPDSAKFACTIQYSFAPKSSFLSGYMQNLPKCAGMTPYRYTPSHTRSNRQHWRAPAQDARFPVVTGLTFPGVLPVTRM
ncbi:hypothetical protein B0H13DRAFT_2042959 [Mycena leptocephala]|nr:hypothetical protein B0H13DRAFT_2042959 [Mycena leptocephala]